DDYWAGHFEPPPPISRTMGLLRMWTVGTDPYLPDPHPVVAADLAAVAQGPDPGAPSPLLQSSWTAPRRAAGTGANSGRPISAGSPTSPAVPSPATRCGKAGSGRGAGCCRR